MKHYQLAILAMLIVIPIQALSQDVTPRDINGARNSADEGTSFDTNVTFTLRMTLAGESTLRDTASLGEDISIKTVIRPREEDIGLPADVMIVDYKPPMLSMRNTDGNFVTWNGSLRSLVPAVEGVTLEEETEVEVFSGQLGVTGNHRVFVGFMVGEALYFTPQAMRFDIVEESSETTALEQAMALFESTISPNIVQSICIQCHVNGGQASGQALHIFVRTTNSDHLDINFGEFEEVHTARGTDFILSKVQGQLNHGGGFQLASGSENFNSLENFLQLLDEAQAEGTASGLEGGSQDSDPVDQPPPGY